MAKTPRRVKSDIVPQLPESRVEPTSSPPFGRMPCSKHQVPHLPPGFCLSITSYLDQFDVDPETKRVLRVALEMTRAAIGFRDNHANGIIAKRLIELAKAGERNPDRLCEGALEKLREHLFGD
jgi:hypothetical protein